MNIATSADSVGSLIRERRLLRNWTQQDLADATGLTATYISRVERAEVGVPSQPNLVRFGAALGVPLYQFYQAAGWLDGLDLPAPPDRSPAADLVAALSAMHPDFNAQLTRLRTIEGEAVYQLVLSKLADSVATQGATAVALVQQAARRSSDD